MKKVVLCNLTEAENVQVFSLGRDAKVLMVSQGVDNFGGFGDVVIHVEVNPATVGRPVDTEIAVFGAGAMIDDAYTYVTTLITSNNISRYIYWKRFV